MSKIITTNLKHFNRMEDQEILEYVAEHNNIGHVSVFGTSGTGKQNLYHRLSVCYITVISSVAIQYCIMMRHKFQKIVLWMYFTIY